MRIFFASDVHGSTRCFIKFINTPNIYGAKVLILGGDICGKFIVPIIRSSDGSWRTTFLGRAYVVNSREKLRELEERIEISGAYYYETNEEEWNELANNKDKLHDLMIKLMKERVRGWIALCEERLGGRDVKVFISPGNDDPYEIDELLKSSHDNIVLGDGIVSRINERHEILMLGVSNKTPWNCPRDIEEDEIKARIDDLVSRMESVETSIFSIHVPPYGSGLDIAPQLDKNLKPVLGPGGAPVMIACGSIAVREAIERYQPMLGLHGHIHESRGAYCIGKTLCLNPGSEYGEGILRGVLIEIRDGKVRDYLFTQG
jgi:Icc-related predicted phosphoesterase